MLLVGAIFGFVMGRRMLLAELDEARRAEARRARRDAVLDAELDAEPVSPSPPPAPSSSE